MAGLHFASPYTYSGLLEQKTKGELFCLSPFLCYFIKCIFIFLKFLCYAAMCREKPHLVAEAQKKLNGKPTPHEIRSLFLASS